MDAALKFLFSPLGKVLLALLVILLLILAVLSWGQSRYDAGVADTDAKWEEAGRKLEGQARASGKAADVREADRIEDHAARMADQKEKIDEAVARGDSPLDALFGG